MNEWGIMVCGHGSRDGQAVEEFQAVARGLRERMPEHETEWGFLEFATPIIRDGLDALRTKGFRKVLAVPGMLFAAGHAKNDIPSVLNTYQTQHPGMDIRYGRELGIDLKLIRAAGERVEVAITEAGDHISRHETLLVVVDNKLRRPSDIAGAAPFATTCWTLRA
mgnify:CR=1 FL=1